MRYGKAIIHLARMRERVAQKLHKDCSCLDLDNGLKFHLILSSKEFKIFD